MNIRDIDRCARTQHGLITHTQLVDLGMSASTIARSRNASRLIDVGRGVYRLAGSPTSWRQQVMAATLGAVRAFASHRTAAALHFAGVGGGIVEICGEGLQRTRRPGVKAHVTKDLPPADQWLIDSIPVTGIDRTLVDVGRYWPQERVGQLLDQAVRDRWTTYERFEERVAALGKRGRNGITTARLVLEARGFDDGWGFERAMQNALRVADLGPVVREHRVDVGQRHYYIDFAYPEARLGIECDSSMWHTLPYQFESDLRRQNEIQSQGILLLRYTPSRLRHDPDAVIAEIRSAVASRSTRFAGNS